MPAANESCLLAWPGSIFGLPVAPLARICELRCARGISKALCCTSAPGILALPVWQYAEFHPDGPARSLPGSKWRCIHCNHAEYALGTSRSPLFGFFFPSTLANRIPSCPRLPAFKAIPLRRSRVLAVFLSRCLAGLRMVCVSRDRGPL